MQGEVTRKEYRNPCPKNLGWDEEIQSACAVESHEGWKEQQELYFKRNKSDMNKLLLYFLLNLYLDYYILAIP